MCHCHASIHHKLFYFILFHSDFPNFYQSEYDVQSLTSPDIIPVLGPLVLSPIISKNTFNWTFCPEIMGMLKIKDLCSFLILSL